MMTDTKKADSIKATHFISYAGYGRQRICQGPQLVCQGPQDLMTAWYMLQSFKLTAWI